MAAYTYSTSSSNNVAGHLIDEKAYLNGTLISERAPSVYDQMGRLKTELQTPYSPTTTAYTLSNTWNYAGGLSTSGNTATGITLTYLPDSVNRLSSVTSSMASNGGLTFPTTLYSVSGYSAAGMTHSTFAGDPNNTGLFEQFRFYDTRGRVLDNEIYANTDTFASGTVIITGLENTCISGSGGTCVADTGTVHVSAGSMAESVPFDAMSTVQTIGNALAAAFNQRQDVNSTVNASVSQSGPPNSQCQNGTTTTAPNLPCVVLTLTADQFSSYGNVTLTALETDADSSSASFSVSPSGTMLTGGGGDSPQSGYVYVYRLQYDKTGNVVAATDPYNGAWFYGYDTLNRLVSSGYNIFQGNGVNTPAGNAIYQCWAYDGFGNRLFEADELRANSPASCPSSLTTANSTHWAKYGPNDRITQSDTMATGPGYDAAGNVIQDTLNKYVYDSEGRLCAVQNTVSGTAIQYIYDAEGRRSAKGTLSTWPVAGSVCAAPIAANGFTLASSYLRGVSGAEDVELWQGTGAWRHNVFGPGGLLATYNFSNSGSTPLSLSFAFNDWLGTKRAEVNASGQLVNWWSSDPFGDYLTPHNSAVDPSEQHFTGQERDVESGNDYFDARYYPSTMGRFMSPDPGWFLSASSANPQSWNQFGYTMNNPLTFVDPSGLVLQLVCNSREFYDVAQAGTTTTATVTDSANCYSYEDYVGVPSGRFSYTPSPDPVPLPGHDPNSGITKAQTACAADVVINYALGFIPGYNAAKLAFTLAGGNVNFVQNALAGKSIVTFDNPLTITDNIKGIFWGTNALASTGSTVLKAAAAPMDALDALTKVAGTAGTIANLVNTASAAYDLYKCKDAE